MVLTSVAVALIPALYWPALHATYRIDDYAWLSLANTMAHGRSLWWALFSPQAQGTIRPLGERLWFLAASSWFGLNPAPLHALAMVVQALNVLLVADIGRRLLGSPLAGGIAAALWVINSSLVDPLVWSSAINEVTCTCFFLAAFDAFLRWADSGKKRWLVLHVVALILALGALELAVTFPAIVAAYLLLVRRRDAKLLAPSAGVAAVYIAAHLWAVHLPHTGPYALTAGWGAARNLARFWAEVLGPQEFYRTHGGSLLLTRAGTILLSAILLLAVIIRARRSDLAPAFGLVWFVIVLAPVLPLSDHFIFYYPFLPSVGLAWLAGGALAHASSWRTRWVALAGVALYAMCEIPATVSIRNYDLNQSRDTARREMRLAEQVREIRGRQPEGALFLSGMDMEQFWWGLCYGELYKEGFRDLHILPDAGDHGIPIPPDEWCYRQDFQYSREKAARILAAGEGRIYDMSQSPPKALAFHPGF